MSIVQALLHKNGDGKSMFTDVAIDEFLKLEETGNKVLIDVRSPSEFKEFTIPGSVNIPLFNDEERAEIGTIYKRVSVEAAKERGLEIASGKLPVLVKRFRELEGPILLFCWRGGMRSKAVSTVLDLVGMDVIRLTGGLQAYRNWVVDKLGQFEFPQELIVLNGYTGAGKTLILKKLEQEGYPILDLESLANHRGSIFGQIGLKANNQRQFESLLVHDLFKLQGKPFIMIEAESKRIGKSVLPDFLVEKKKQSVQLFVEMPMETRVQHILEEYRPKEHQGEYLKAFRKIRNRIHTPVAKEIESYIESGQFADAVQLLLKHYYDPRYEHSAEQYGQDQRIILEAQSVDEAVDHIRSYLNDTYSKRQALK